MCWRGHGVEYLNKEGHCKECHRLRAKRIRAGLPPVYKPKYRIRLDVLKHHRKIYKRRFPSVRIIAELGGVPYDTVGSWIWHGHNATYDNAIKFAMSAQIPFETLFERVR